MTKNLTQLQSDLLKLAQTRDINKMSLRQIGTLLGGEHPYAVQLAKKSLIKEGRFIYNARTDAVSLPQNTFTANSLIQIPILGRVSCGVATELAFSGPHDFLPVSPSLVNTKRWDNIFALIATGDSMNQSSIQGNSVDDGDYVIVRKTDDYVPKDNDYVISRIDGVYNLKKLRIDQAQRRVVLLSESTEEYMPIFIAKEDIYNYSIEGLVIDVVKGVNIQD